MKTTKKPLPFNIVPYITPLHAQFQKEKIFLCSVESLQSGVHSFVSISRFRRNDKKRISAMALANSANNRHIFPLVYSRARCRFF